MRVLLFVLLVLYSIPGHAETRIARQKDDWIRLFDAPCTNELVLARVIPELKQTFHRAGVYLDAKLYDACWRDVGTETIGLLYEDGDAGLIPVTEFQPDGV